MKAFILAVLGLVAVGDACTVSLRVKFGLYPDAFLPLPLNMTQAQDRGWVEHELPQMVTPLFNVVLYADPADRTVGLFFDVDTHGLVGMNIALRKDKLKKVIFELGSLGWCDWDVTVDGETFEYFAIQQYFMEPGSLTRNAADRIASYKPDQILQGECLYLPGFNGTIFCVPTDEHKILTETEFTRQSIFPQMGRHFFFNMTKDTKCTADQMYTSFLLTDNYELQGYGMVIFVQVKDQSKMFENPGRTAMKVIVPNGPPCLYDLSEFLITLHVYLKCEPWFLGVPRLGKK